MLTMPEQLGPDCSKLAMLLVNKMLYLLPFFVEKMLGTFAKVLHDMAHL